jgi:hypothetical protein
MNEPLIHSKNAVVAYLHTAEVLQPGNGPLDFPATTITAQLASVLVAPQNAIAAIGNDEVDVPSPQALAQRVAVIAFVGYDSWGLGTGSAPSPARHADQRQRAFRELVLRRFGVRQLYSERNAAAVDHHHALCTLAAHGFTHFSAPFLATMNVASRNASFQSSSCRRSMSASSCCQARSHTPRSSQVRNRRQHVDPLGYFSGRSRQRAPVRNTHKMPPTQARLLIQGLPRPSRRCLGTGKNASMRFHCWAVSICPQPTTTRLRHISPQLDAEPIYETSSRSFASLRMTQDRWCFVVARKSVRDVRQTCDDSLLAIYKALSS